MKQQLLPATLTALKILQILEEFSDQDHPVAQTAIAEELDIDRKTVARCLEVIEGHMDYDIVHQRKGVYLVPDEDSFELSEIRLLIDSVSANNGITKEKRAEKLLQIREYRQKKYRVFITFVMNTRYGLSDKT